MWTGFGGWTFGRITGSEGLSWVCVVCMGTSVCKHIHCDQVSSTSADSWTSSRRLLVLCKTCPWAGASRLGIGTKDSILSQ